MKPAIPDAVLQAAACPGSSDLAAPSRLVALDHLRGFVVVLVVLHHAVLAYCTFGRIDPRHYVLSTAPIVDGQRWAGFDVLVTLNDGFFMPLLFLLSGLFVRGGLARKGAAPYLQGRLLRLGLPFAVTALTLVPLAYYPSFLQAGGAPGFAAFLAATVTTGPWPSGPPWFVAVLLFLDAGAAAVSIVSGRPGPAGKVRATAKPGPCFGLLLACFILAYLPFLAAFGPARWLSFGPLAVQGSRVGLYAAYFAAGIALGAGGRQGAALLGAQLAGRWAGWGSLAVLAGTVFVGVAAWRAYGGGAGLPPWLGGSMSGMALAVFCAAASFAAVALSFRFGEKRGSLAGSLAANSYGIYLLHYPAVTWTQYGLLRTPVGATIKGIAVFAVALLASWGGTTLLRWVLGVHRVV